MLFLMTMLAMEFTPSGKVNLSDYQIFSTDISYTVNDDRVIAIILDEKEKLLLLFDAQGQLIAKCGRKGQGPGEFQSPDAVWWDPQAKGFAVYDSESGRISKWTAQGKLVSENSMTTRIKNPGYVDEKTLFFTHNTRGIFNDTPAVQKMDLSTGEFQTIWQVPGKRYELPRVRIGTATMVVSTVWDPVVTYGLGKDFIAVSYTGYGTVDILDMNGKTHKKITPKLAQYEVTDEEITEQINGSFRVARETLMRKRGELYEGKHWPKIRTLMVDAQNRIWIIGQPARSTGHYPVHIYTDQGRLAAEKTLPFEPTYLAGGRLYYVHENQQEEVILETAAIKF